MKNNKVKLWAKWEVLTMAEALDNEYKDVIITQDHREFFKTYYQGNYINFWLDERVGYRQNWKIKIITTAQNDDGEICEHELDWSFDKPMSMAEVLKGAENIKVNEKGFKVRWQGVTKQWLDFVDEDLAGMTCISAWVTATCESKVKPTTAKENFFRMMKNV